MGPLSSSPPLATGAPGDAARLHDGTQQRLVDLAFTLRRASRRAGGDPELRELLADAMTVLDDALGALGGRGGNIHATGTPPPTDPTATLTAKEREVLALVAEGHSNDRIAQRLEVTSRTVESHTSRIFTKLGLEADPAVHRRVLAALTHLRASGPPSP